METTNGNEKWNATQSKRKKSDEKEKQPYIKGLKKSKPNTVTETIGSKKA